MRDFLTNRAQEGYFSPPIRGWEKRTAPGFSSWCKNNGSFTFDESCVEDWVSEVEAVAVTVAAIEGASKLLKENERKIPKFC